MIKKLVLSLLLLSTSLSAFIPLPLMGIPIAIAIDCAVILSKKSNRDAILEFLKVSFQITEDALVQANKLRHYAVKKGKTDLEFWKKYAKKNNFPLPADWDEQFLKVVLEVTGMEKRIYDLLTHLKDKKVTVGVITHNEGSVNRLHLKDLGIYHLFTHIKMLCPHHTKNHELDCYEQIVKKMNLPPQNIIVIDKNAESIAKAKNLGFDAILYTSASQLEEELKKREVLTENPQKSTQVEFAL